MAGVPGSFVGVPELECIVDELAVLTHGADHGMIAHKRQQFLLSRSGRLMSDRMVLR